MRTEIHQRLFEGQCIQFAEIDTERYVSRSAGLEVVLNGRLFSEGDFLLSLWKGDFAVRWEERLVAKRVRRK
jgi:hypothetical protein